MELPTYTNIWKIEKRLYKLYDFRLPMPLPVGQIAAFLAIAVPYTLILTLVGMPFSHTWLWLYVLPPGVLAWLVTRPVLEGKRLPELVLSQLRYLGEPGTWCRMAPLAERDEIFIVARVWRSAGFIAPAAAPAAVSALAAVSAPDAGAVSALAARAVSAHVVASDAVAAPPARAAGRSSPARSRAAVPAQSPGARSRGAESPGAQSPGAQSADGQSARQQPASLRLRGRTGARPAGTQSAGTQSAGTQFPVARRPAPWPASAAANLAPAGEQLATLPVSAAPAHSGPVLPAHSGPVAAAHSGPVPSAAAPRPPAAWPVIRMTGDGAPVGPLNVVERALRSSPAGRAAGRREPVVIVPGGHRPGKPDQVQRDQARARLPLPASARVVVLGCTVGAGQTTTTLLTGQLLASLRGEAVAVLDLSHGQGALTEQARSIPVLLPSQRAGADPAGAQQSSERGLQVVTAGGSVEDAGQIINSVVARYPLTLADPDAGCVPKSLRVADQLILVAPASADAASSLAMTLEWLEAHDHGRLSAGAITVLNGVSALTTQHAGKAAAVAAGRCRAIVQVPWDERLRSESSQPLGLATVQAYTALAGVLVSGLADAVTGSAVR